MSVELLGAVVPAAWFLGTAVAHGLAVLMGRG